MKRITKEGEHTLQRLEEKNVILIYTKSYF